MAATYNATVFTVTPKGVVSAQAVQAIKVGTGLGFRVLRAAGHFSYYSGTEEFHHVWMADPHMPEDGWREIEWDGGQGVLDFLGR